MAKTGQKIQYVSREDLKEKYQNRKDRIESMCKAISQSLQTKIYVSVAPNGTVRFEFVGQRIKRAQEYIMGEFCKASSSKAGARKSEPHRLSQSALKVLPEEDQSKLLREGNPFLLTEAALRKHDISTGALELREFACENCDRYWWKTVPCTKPVSKCFKCKTKYDALPRDLEFGIGRYKCFGCNKIFFARCEATSERSCFNCDGTVRAPYIHPKFKPIRRNRPPIDPTTSVFKPPKYHAKYVYTVQDPSTDYLLPCPVFFYFPLQTKPHKKAVINASKVHDSTGSTASTFITQIEFPGRLYERETEDTIPVVISDPESDEEDIIICSSSTDSETDEESPPPECEGDSNTDLESTSGAVAGSDSSSDSDGPQDKLPRKRSNVSSSSDSDSDSKDAYIGKKTPGAPSKQSPRDSGGLFEQESTISSTKDSGLGTAGSLDTRSTAATKSTTSGSYGSVPRASVAAFNPTDFPGIVFSKECAKKDVDHKGAVITGEGIRLNVPEYAVQSGDSIPIELQACLDGPFVLPKDTVLVSPVYRIAPPCAFRQAVTLTIEHFAELNSPEDCDDMFFISSPTKPKIRKHKDEAYWKFKVYTKPVCTPKSQHGDVHLSHFCLGALARRLSRDQRYRYCVSWYSPQNYIPPRCHVIFSVTLHHEVYIRNLERYLEKSFKNQSFLSFNELIYSPESKIELELPTDPQGYKIVTHKVCRIQKDQVDYALKFKRRARSENSAYPPRIILTISKLNDDEDTPLDCRINVKGIREFPYFELHVAPPAASEVSSQRSFEAAGAEQDKPLQMGDLNGIVSYLRDLDEEHCISLGLQFGLRYSKLKKMKQYPHDVVEAWLIKQDNVTEQCPPTWRSLIAALRSIDQTGIADDVRKARDL